MDEFSISQRSQQTMKQTKSIGVKLIVVCGLALLMTIPSLFVNGLIGDRTTSAEEVTKEIGNDVGGQQVFLGPTLAIPYDVVPLSPNSRTEHGTYLVFPKQAGAVVKTATEERRRSLFRVPVFHADLQFDAMFDLTGVPALALPGAHLDWDRAKILVGASDARGALTDGTLIADGKTLALNPSESNVNLSVKNTQNQQNSLAIFGAETAGVAKPNAQFKVTAELHFSGAQRIGVLAYGKTTQLTVTGDWPDPGFNGGFLPASHSVSDKGFSAQWTVPYIARGVAVEGPSDLITGLDDTELGVSFVEVADPYQSVSRALKYVPLFLGLVFLSYFVFEATTGKRVHPAQYILVGVAQLIFYLLLLSFAERVGFNFGFLIAAVATVGLLAVNAGWIFASRTQGARALAIFSMVYGLIYMLLRLEDNALMVGAIASFAAVTAVMYFTRKIDWYGALPGPISRDKEANDGVQSESAGAQST
jgi:inner membrane protein